MGPESREYRTPAALLPYQQRWVADTRDVKLCEKSRRIGLSWAEAADCALAASSSREAGGMDCWYIGYNKDMALEFIEDCADWARHYALAAAAVEEFVFEDDEKKAILSYKIRFASGFKMVALSSRPANLRGKQGRIVIDEAAFHDDLAGLMKAALAMLMWGGRVHVISTHFGETNPFNELIAETRAGKKPYSVHRITLDNAIEDGLYRRICLRLGRDWTPEGEAAWREDLVRKYGDDADEELFCIPSQGTGLYLTRIVVESCMDPEIPVLRWACPADFATRPDADRAAACLDWCREHLDPVLATLAPNRPCFVGEDFGRSGDLSVVLPLQETDGLRYRAPCLIELRNVPFREQEQLFTHLVDAFPWFRGGALDARGNGQYLAERAMQRYGAHRIHQVMLTEPWYMERMPKYKDAFESRAILLPKDPDVLDDHLAIRVVRGVARLPEGRRSKGRDGGQRHGDSAIAGALAWYATEIDAGPVEYQSVSTRRFAGDGDEGDERGAW